MASPHATGVVALIVGQYGKRDRVHGGLTMNPDKVERILLDTATDTPCPEPREYHYPEDTTGTFDATCEGSRDRNGFYGDGIVDADTLPARRRSQDRHRSIAGPSRNGCICRPFSGP